MIPHLHENTPAEQTLKNLHFLIALELQKTSATTADERASAQAHVVLRRLMAMEEVLRSRHLCDASRHAGVAA